jgi:MHS family proline/betaine transporter-like MFS transporter
MSSVEATAAPPSHRRNRLLATSGVVIEWYDFMVYALLATTIQKVFYPTEDTTVGLILTFATFAVGYLARPFGGMVIGRLGDLRGRRYALVLSTSLMLIPLFVITVLPGYATLGIWAPILLTLMRLMQGFSVGGEYSGALTALSESAGSNGRGRSVSLGLATAMAGNLLASLVVFGTTAIGGQDALASGTWRIPFAIGLVACIASVLLQKRMHETAEFEESKESGATGSPLVTLIRMYPRETLAMAALATWSGITVYTLISWLPSFLETVIGDTDEQSQLTSALISAIYMVAVIPVAILGDRVGRRRIMLSCIALYIVLAIPATLLIDNGGFLALLPAVFVLAILQTGVDSSTTTEMTRLVPTSVRYSGIAITYSLGMILGSFSPAAEELFISATGSNLVPAFILIGISLIMLPVVWLLPRLRSWD